MDWQERRLKVRRPVKTWQERRTGQSGLRCDSGDQGMLGGVQGSPSEVEGLPTNQKEKEVVTSEVPSLGNTGKKETFREKDQTLGV